jgi:hypothetical protein
LIILIILNKEYVSYEAPHQQIHTLRKIQQTILESVVRNRAVWRSGNTVDSLGSPRFESWAGYLVY